MMGNFYQNMGWAQISFILCMFGLFKEFRPSEPFVTDYLTGRWKNFTAKEVSQEIYPIGTYSYLATLVLVFLLTDFLRYKPVIILCGLSGTVTFVTMVFATSMPAFQFLEFTYGVFFSTEVAYYTYIYAKVDKKHYQAVSSYTRGSYLIGKFLSGVVGQCAATFDILDYHELVYVTILDIRATIPQFPRLSINGLGLATVWACLIPPVGKSLYFHRSDDSNEAESQQIRNRLSGTQQLALGLDGQSKASQESLHTHVHYPEPNFATKFRRAYVYLWQDFLRAYTNSHVVKWSLWWAFATAGYLQVASYIQPLWQTAVEKDAKIYNGAVEAIYTIIGAVTVFAVGKLRLNWPVLGEGLLSIFSILEAFILFVCSQSYNIWLQYTVYIIFGVIYHTIITVASFEVAKNLADDSYGLVFGLNTLVALTIQSLLTFVVIDKNALGLESRPQFEVYAGYFLVLGVVFLFMAVYTAIRFFRSGEDFHLWLKKEIVTDGVQDESIVKFHKDQNPS